MAMKKTFERIENKSRRSQYLANQIRLGLRFQMRALRKARGNMTQDELAKSIGSQQTAISRVENHNADRLSIPTLLKLAEAFDVGVVVRFEPIDDLVEWYDGLSPEKLAPRPSEEIIAEALDDKEAPPKIAARGRFKVLTGKNRNPDQPSIFRPRAVAELPTPKMEVPEYDGLKEATFRDKAGKAA